MEDADLEDADWVLDVTDLDAEMVEVGMLPFVPVEYEEGEPTLTLVVGLTFISSLPPGNFLGVIHANGVDAVEQWCEENRNIIESIVQGIQERSS